MNDVLTAAGVTTAKLRLEINGILNIINFLTAVGACFLIDKFGRRPLFLTATAGMLGSFIIWTICAARYTITKSKAASTAEITFIFIYYLFYNTAWSGLLVGYAVEILPYKLRAKGLTLMFLAVDLSLFFNSYVNPVALGHLKWKYYIVYDCWLAFELAIVYFFYIETMNTPLEEIVKYFDGEDALLGGDVATEKGRAMLEEDHIDSKSPAVAHHEVDGQVTPEHKI